MSKTCMKSRLFAYQLPKSPHIFSILGPVSSAGAHGYIQSKWEAENSRNHHNKHPRPFPAQKMPCEHTLSMGRAGGVTVCQIRLMAIEGAWLPKDNHYYTEAKIAIKRIGVSQL